MGPPAVFSRAQEIFPIFDEDSDIIASAPEETIITAPEITTEPIFEVVDLNEIDLIKAAPKPVIAPKPIVEFEPFSAPEPVIVPDFATEFPFPPMPTEAPIFEVFENDIEAVIHSEKVSICSYPKNQ